MYRDQEFIERCYCDAPAVAGLTRRLAAEPALANLAAVSREQFGDGYCGGEIEKSLRRVIG